MNEMTVKYAIEIGRRLNEAKAVLEHGQWGPWLEREVNFSQSTANNYMKIFERYGSDQVSLFGDAKSQTLGNLPYTKALKLLAVPEDEVETFVEEHDVANMSTRELEQAIRERDEAKRKLEAVQDDAAQVILDAEEAVEKAKGEAETLRKELEELKARPVEVAVDKIRTRRKEAGLTQAELAEKIGVSTMSIRRYESGDRIITDDILGRIANALNVSLFEFYEDGTVEAPSKEILDQIRAEEAQKAAVAAAELEKKLAAAEAKAAKAEDKAKKLKDKVDKAGEDAKAAMQKDIEAAAAAQKAAEAAKADAEARAKALEEKLKTADGDAAVFKVYFSRVQEDLNRMLGMIQKAEPEQKEKFRTALRALLDSVGGAM